MTVNVDLAGTNSNPQITVAPVQPGVTEGVLASFTVAASAAVSGPVGVNLSFSGLAGHTVDFNGSVSVEIPDDGSSAVLLLPTINDNLFEGLENIVVNIESVSGDAVVGGTSAAEVLLNDAQTEPEFTISADQDSGAEGIAAGFTITPTVPSQEDRTLTVSYSGEAVNGSDYLGSTSVVVPGGSADGVLAIIPFDDTVAEGAEVLTVTLESVDVGTIGAANSASTDITDGSGQLLFFADFNDIDPAGDPGTPGGTTVGLDAPFAAELGTEVGSWEGVPTATLGGDIPGVYFEIDDAKGDGVDEALVLDRVPVGEGDIIARLAAPADLTGSSTALITMDLGNRRTQGNSEAKSWRIIGLDDAGEKSFELYVSGNNNAPHNEQLHHVDSAGNLTPLGNPADFDNTGSIEEETEQSSLL
ncbi:MAG: hypothetical protein GWO24_25525, partial [Akkermansiaceae bacterium]|nr:hypothetical protein [Akkermansiaceae bacterium]